MIRLTCTHCKTVLTIDDAFAGGVCRCQHCGTIQTVPSHLKPKPGQKIDPAEALKQPKTLYQRKSRSSTTGSGLDDLADAVTGSSHLASSRLEAPPPPPPEPQPPARNHLMIIAAVLLLILFAAIVYLLFAHPNALL
ncbi:MAG: hypothetical protein IT446_04270 [Phycisphaerales bacterium]|jgi:hypothetical protein|nr:hypothetical protein [Phycisphaerales bacterium]